MLCTSEALDLQQCSVDFFFGIQGSRDLEQGAPVVYVYRKIRYIRKIRSWV